MEEKKEVTTLCFCPKCGLLGTKSYGICKVCRVRLVDTGKTLNDYHNELVQGRGPEFMDNLRKEYVLTSPQLDIEKYNKRDEEERKKREKTEALIRKYETTLHCPRCWSFNVKETFVSSIITGLFFSATPTWFCNNCHFKWKK